MRIPLELNDAARSYLLKFAMIAFVGWLAGMSRYVTPTSFGDNIFHIGHPLHLLHPLIYLTAYGGAIWMLFRALNHMGLYPISLVVLFGIVLTAIMAVDVTYRYVTQVYALTTNQFNEATGPAIVYPPGSRHRYVSFQVDNQEFVIAKGDKNTLFTYPMKGEPLTKYPAVRVSYTSSGEIIKIVGLTDNNALESTR